MQVEREIPGMSFDEMKRKFDAPEEYTAEKLESALNEPDVKEVHVFKATPINMDFARLREHYPNKSRRELRKMLKLLRRKS